MWKPQGYYDNKKGRCIEMFSFYCKMVWRKKVDFYFVIEKVNGQSELCKHVLVYWAWEYIDMVSNNLSTYCKGWEISCWALYMLVTIENPNIPQTLTIQKKIALYMIRLTFHNLTFATNVICNLPSKLSIRKCI